MILSHFYSQKIAVLIQVEDVYILSVWYMFTCLFVFSFFIACDGYNGP